MDENDNPILHVLVVGFHHKKGCQIEYSFPPLSENSPEECPASWKYLPTLALPDGSHNYDSDTVYFHLPSLTEPTKTIYGISCFRQIPVENLKNKTDDITRSTVQKSVCVLSKIPLYGHIQVKMSLITHAYFDEGDFSKTSILNEAYYNLNTCLQQSNAQISSQIFEGLSVRELVLQWRHKIVLLFKLLLLEKRVIFYKTPVYQLCSTILSLLSLHPGMIESGIEQSACIKASRSFSPEFESQFTNLTETEGANKLEEDLGGCDNFITCATTFKSQVKIENQKNQQSNEIIVEQPHEKLNKNVQSKNSQRDNELKNNKIENVTNELNQNFKNFENNRIENNEEIEITKVENNLLNTENNLNGTKIDLEPLENDLNKAKIDHLNFVENYFKEEPSIGKKENFESQLLAREQSFETITNDAITAQQNNLLNSIAQIDPISCGLPLPIFQKGYLCLPYLSLPYMDLLNDCNVRGFVIGATNFLFKQKRHQIADILIEIETLRIETNDIELRKLLHLTTEDLRFADYLVKHVAGTSDLNPENLPDVFLDGVGWDGGDEWIRSQFRVYLLSLLRTSLLPDGSKEFDHYNSYFMNTWKETYNYKTWLNSGKSRDGIMELNPGHPFAGQLSVADMKLRLAHTMQNTEGGRKLNQAMMSTGRAVATTGRAVGGALSQAKGVFSNWWSNFNVQNTQEIDQVSSTSSNSLKSNEEKIDSNNEFNQSAISVTDPTITEKDYDEKDVDDVLNHGINHCEIKQCVKSFVKFTNDVDTTTTDCCHETNLEHLNNFEFQNNELNNRCCNVELKNNELEEESIEYRMETQNENFLNDEIYKPGDGDVRLIEESSGERQGFRILKN